MLNEREMVEQFHEAMGLPARERPEMPSEDEVELRARLTLEEALEFVRACGFAVRWGRLVTQGQYDFTLERRHPADLAAMAQENADVRVITHGTDLYGGFPPSVFSEVMAANMRKVGPDGKVHRRSDGKVIKPPGFRPADVAAVLARFTQSKPGET